MNEITEEQRSIIIAMCSHMKLRVGPPSLRQIARAVGVRHKSTMQKKMQALERLRLVVQWPGESYIPAEIYDATRDAAANLEIILKQWPTVHRDKQTRS